MQRILIILFICALINLAFAAAPPSFCKCTCFKNSTIIELGPNNPLSSHDINPASLSLRSLLESRAAGNGGSSCINCNRTLCRAPGRLCESAEEEDVFTTCFQRDSRKDQIIVLLFIAVTVGLLVWAGVRRLLEKREVGRGARAEGLGEYAAVGGG